MDKGDIEFVIGLLFSILAFCGLDWKWFRRYIPVPPINRRNLFVLIGISGSILFSVLGWIRYHHEMLAKSPVVIMRTPAPPLSNPSRQTQPSAYSELKKVTEAVDKESKDWINGVDMCQSLHDKWLAGVEGEGNPPTQADKGRASRRYVKCMQRLMDGFHMEDSMAIGSAVEDAIARMQKPGKLQITPNRASALSREFKDALTKSQNGPSLENPKPDVNDRLRFKPLLDFLTGLLKQLGNYPESP